jgi:hypothetical protein
MTSDVIEQQEPAVAEAQATEAPAVETPASDEQPQTQEQPQGDPLTPEQRRLKQLQRTVDRRTERLGGLSRENQLLREQLAKFEQSASVPADQDDEPARLTPADIDRLANERARELRLQDTVRERAAVVMSAGKKLDGFDEAVNAVAEEVPFTDRAGRPTPFIQAVFEADKPAEVLHYLGRNPDEAAKFVGMTPAQIGRHLAKLEDRIERDAKSMSNAPPPLRPVNPRSDSRSSPRTQEDLMQELRGLRR